MHDVTQPNRRLHETAGVYTMLMEAFRLWSATASDFGDQAKRFGIVAELAARDVQEGVQ